MKNSPGGGALDATCGMRRQLWGICAMSNCPAPKTCLVCTSLGVYGLRWDSLTRFVFELEKPKSCQEALDLDTAKNGEDEKNVPERQA